MNTSDIEGTRVGVAEVGWSRVFLGYAPYLVLGLLLSGAIPDQGITLPILKALIDAVGGIVPSIHRLAALSPLPEMTRAFGALMWLAYPIFTVWGCWRSPRIPLKAMSWLGLLLMLPLFAAALVLLGVLAPFFFVSDAPQPSYLGGRGAAGLAFLITSRIGHGTLGSLIFVFSSVCLVFLWRLALDYPRLLAYNLRKGLERRKVQ